ncbi:predicted protein [Naegleria gruberi]|uniref:Predicted protein n=1 Tax=Naegleria gruberi TaxID=5762 RepID=D2V0W3_NAEGR|nr:uncharacterized protein NAEGRDRAFT_45793 [Naegleria gruberi]EFC49801.1 predicted protein [Naegleria gruberi]|eukprot:XP_002682545.1 predicted protein [Naegleria gruberi strain NEG-M]
MRRILSSTTTSSRNVIFSRVNFNNSTTNHHHQYHHCEHFPALSGLTTCCYHTNLTNNNKRQEQRILDEKTAIIVESFKKLCIENEIPLPLDDKTLLTSIVQTRGLSSEGSRLNFVGRNVTALCVADYLFAHFPNLTHDHLVMATLEFLKNRTIVQVAKSLKLDGLLSSSLTLVASSNNLNNRDDSDLDNPPIDSEVTGSGLNIERNNLDSLLVFSIYRMVGALFEQHGLMEARKFIVRNLIAQSIDITAMLQYFDPKTQLAQMVRTGEMHEHAHKTVQYKEVSKDEKRFVTVHVYVDNDVIGEGTGQTKKIAEQKAAQDALNKWFSHYYSAPTPLQKFN